MVETHPSLNHNAFHPANPPNLDTAVCLLVGDRLVSLVAGMVMIVVNNSRVTNMLTQNRGWNLCCICGVLVRKRRIPNPVWLMISNIFRWRPL